MDDRFFVKKQKLALPMGRQFEALDQTAKETVLIHRFSKGDSDKKDIWREVFKQYAEKLQKLSNASLPQVIAYGVDDQGPHLIMKEPKGLRLTDVVNCGPMMAASVRQLAEQFLLASKEGAQAGLYHTALNPMLVLVGESEGEGNLFLFTDLGFAEIHNEIQGEEGRVLGDPAFLSPKQLRGEEQDEIGCLFSIGQLCYYCLAGGHPFGGMALNAILQGYENGQFPAIDQFRADLPTDFVQWLNKMTAVDRSQRFQSFDEALAALPAVGGLVAIPMDLTGAVNVQPTSATSTQAVVPHNKPKLITGTQAVRPAMPQTGTQAVRASVTARQSVQPAQPVPAVAGLVNSPSSADADKKKKIIMASSIGGGVLLLLIIILVAASGGDEKPTDASADKAGNSEVPAKEVGMDEETKALFRGLAYGWNFDQDLLPINTNKPAIVPYKNIDYGEGLHKKSLILGPDNYYAIPKESGVFIEKYSESTVSVWIKVPAQWKRGPMILGNKKYNLPGSRGWCLAASPDNLTQMKFRFTSYDGQETRTDDSSLLVSPGRWHLFTVVMKNAESVKFYQDGIFVGEQNIPDLSKLHTGSDVYIGTDGVYRALFEENVEIDQLYIWHRALSASEVKKLHEDKSVYIP